ncbi:MAG: hypothetical protein K8T26_08410 [Lentisphaerae bacterium]|nr:hypothetical protein [Lentisphaerota bacterium]
MSRRSRRAGCIGLVCALLVGMPAVAGVAATNATVSVAVLDFANETIHDAYKPLEQTLPTRLAELLAGQGGIIVVPRERLAGLQTERQLIAMGLVADRDAAPPIHADVVVEGRFYQRQDAAWAVLTLRCPPQALTRVCSVPVTLKDATASTTGLVSACMAFVRDLRPAGGARAPAAPRTAAPRVAIWDFSAVDAATTAHGLGTALADMLMVNLAAEPGLTVVERAELDRLLAEQTIALASMAAAERGPAVGRLAGADLLVQGIVFQRGDALVVQGQIVRPRDVSTLASFELSGRPAELMALVDDLTRRVDEAVLGFGERVERESSPAMRHAEALQYVARAEEYARLGNFPRAADLSKAAAMLDPTIARIYETQLVCHDRMPQLGFDVVEMCLRYIEYEDPHRPRNIIDGCKHRLAQHYSRTQPEVADAYYRDLLEHYGYTGTAPNALHEMYRDNPAKLRETIDYLHDAIRRHGEWTGSKQGIEEIIAAMDRTLGQQKAFQAAPASDGLLTWMSDLAVNGDADGFRRCLEQYVVTNRAPERLPAEIADERLALVEPFMGSFDRDVAAAALDAALALQCAAQRWEAVVELGRRFSVLPMAAESPAVVDRYLLALQKMENVEGAITAYRHLDELTVEEPAKAHTYRLSLAELLEQNGSPREAERLYRSVAFEAYPASAEAQFAQARLGAAAGRDARAATRALLMDGAREDLWRSNHLYGFTRRGLPADGLVLEYAHGFDWRVPGRGRSSRWTWTADGLKPYALVLLSRVTAEALTADERGAVLRYVQDGGNLIVVNAFMSDAPADASWLAAFGVAVDQENALGELPLATARRRPTHVAAALSDQPLTAGLPNLKFHVAHVLKYEQGTAVFAADTYPVAVAGELGKGRYLVLGTTFAFMSGPRYEQADETVAYVRLIRNAFAWMTASR